MTQSNFGEILKQLRTNAHMTQDELACRLKVAKSTVSMYERGERFPSFDIVQSIADVFHVNIDVLYGRQSRTPSLLDLVGATQIDVNLQLFADSPEKSPSKVLSPITPDLGTLTRHEINLLLRYRSKPELQAAVDKLLDVPDGDTQLIPAYVAARSEDGTPDRIEYLTPDEVKRLEDAPHVGFDF